MDSKSINKKLWIYYFRGYAKIFIPCVVMISWFIVDSKQPRNPKLEINYSYSIIILKTCRVNPVIITTEYQSLDLYFWKFFNS